MCLAIDASPIVSNLGKTPGLIAIQGFPRRGVVQLAAHMPRLPEPSELSRADLEARCTELLGLVAELNALVA